MPYLIDGKQFYTVNHAKDHIRNLLKSIGFCKSVKDKNQKIFKRLAKYLQRHQEAYRKGVIDQNYNNLIQDIEIQKNMKGDFELKITKEDGSSQVISWVQCVNPKEKTHRQKLNSAMRQAIDGQIAQFKAQNPNPEKICSNKKCLEEDGIYDCQADHEIRFKDIQQQFLKDHPQGQIKGFDDCPTTQRKKFKKQNEKWKNQWLEFHKKKAKLRWLCFPCNLKRRKQYIEDDDY